MSYKSGAALFVVLATIILVVVLAGTILSLTLNQSRLSHHQISRIQAYYAAQAGMNYAYEQLRSGTWPTSSTTSYNLVDNAFPASISSKTAAITVTPLDGGAGCSSANVPAGTAACITSRVTYTYTMP